MTAKRSILIGTSVALGLALCLLTALALPKTAHACTCAPDVSPAEALDEADAVFAGEVNSVKFSGTSPYRLSSAALMTVEFHVSQVWKGPRREILHVETARFEASCGFEFKEGRHYIVYTREVMRTGLCTRTAPAWMAFADFVALGPGQRPKASPDVTPGPRGGGCAASGGGPVDFAPLGLLIGVAVFSLCPKRRI